MASTDYQAGRGITRAEGASLRGIAHGKRAAAAVGTASVIHIGRVRRLLGFLIKQRKPTKQIIALISAIALVGCATNPLQNARIWKVEDCSGPLGTPNVRFTRPDGRDIAIVSRASCSAVARAAGKIEEVANFRADQIYIADPEVPNAFATLDKEQHPIIVVTVGMLNALGPDEAAWAGLLGHEIAHHVRNHSHGRDEAKVRAELTGQAAGTLIAQFIPGVGGFVAGNATNFVAANALYGAYTRPQEREADELGLQWMVSEGYDPRGMERLFDVLAKQGTGVLPGFLSTHPGAEDRARMVREYVARSGQDLPAIQARFAPSPAPLPPTTYWKNSGGGRMTVTTTAESLSADIVLLNNQSHGTAQLKKDDGIYRGEARLPVKCKTPDTSEGCSATFPIEIFRVSPVSISGRIFSLNPSSGKPEWKMFQWLPQ